MIRAIQKEEVIGQHFWLWPLFCLQAGLINSGGFLACQSFVSHVTGFGTRIGIEFTRGKFLLGLEMLLIPVGFILGCAVAGYFTEVRPTRGKEMAAVVPLGLLSLLLVSVAGLGHLAYFGQFGEPLELQRDFLLLTLLCFGCGLQNATLASITGGTVRTTHLTGISTDLGLNLTRILFNKNQVDMRWFWMRTTKFAFFGFGAALGTILFMKVQYGGFLLPAITNVLLVVWLVISFGNRYSPSECPVPHQCSGTDAV